MKALTPAGLSRPGRSPQFTHILFRPSRLQPHLRPRRRFCTPHQRDGLPEAERLHIRCARSLPRGERAPSRAWCWSAGAPPACGAVRRIGSRLRRSLAGSSNESAESSSCSYSPVVLLLLLSTPPHGDAVAVGLRVGGADAGGLPPPGDVRSRAHEGGAERRSAAGRRRPEADPGGARPRRPRRGRAQTYEDALV